MKKKLRKSGFKYGFYGHFKKIFKKIEWSNVAQNLIFYSGGCQRNFVVSKNVNFIEIGPEIPEIFVFFWIFHIFFSLKIVRSVAVRLHSTRKSSKTLKSSPEKAKSGPAEWRQKNTLFAPPIVSSTAAKPSLSAEPAAIWWKNTMNDVTKTRWKTRKRRVKGVF